MPKAPRKVKAQRKCLAKSTLREPWHGNNAQKRRLTGGKLQRARKSLFEREPLCRPCAQKGKVTLATLRDHVTPLAEGGLDTEENTQPICAACHDEKTRSESIRGALRKKNR